MLELNKQLMHIVFSYTWNVSCVEQENNGFILVKFSFR